jgi:hypothetical protein
MRDPPRATAGSGMAQAVRLTMGVVRHGGVSPAHAFRPQGRVWVHIS